jgi:hypothetical protein
MSNNPKSDYLILVEVTDGMFSREYTINLKLSDGKVVSFFADKELVINEGGKYKLRATLVKRDESRNTDLILLPCETFETSSRWVTVNRQ